MGVVYRIPAYTDTLLPILPDAICIVEELKQCISTPIQPGKKARFIIHALSELWE